MSAEKKIKQTQLLSRAQDDIAASHELAKDAHQVIHQAQALRSQAQAMRSEARQTRGLAAPEDESGLFGTMTEALTVMEACHCLGVGERTLRRVLREPEIRARVVEQSRRVGIYHKFILVLPLNLIADLAVRFAQQKLPRPKPAKS